MKFWIYTTLNDKDNFVDTKQEILNFSNPDLESIIMPVNVRALDQLLKQYRYDDAKRAKLIKGFTNGFRLGYEGSRKIKQKAPNLKLDGIGTQTDLWNKVMKEVEKGHYAGPFVEIPFEYFIQSPISLVPKDQGKDTRLIFHLSYPRNGLSVNSGTPDEVCAVKYPDFNDAVQMCMKEVDRNGKKNGKFVAFSGKSDMKSTFRNLPLLPLDFMLTIMKAIHPQNGQTYYFVDKCLPFGASISCALFQDFSDCMAFIFKRKTKKNMVNYLDDYYFVAMLKTMCDNQIQEFLQICSLINFPVSLEKTVWGSTVIVFLGFLIDGEKMVISIPMEKVARAIELICHILTKKSKKCTLHELQKLCGFLNHLCKCVVPGRAFTRCLYAYTARALLPHHHINITREMRYDLQTWLTFLKSPTIYSRPFADFSQISEAEDLFW